MVFDCMVFLQGAGRPAGPARGCFRLVDEGQVTLCVSPDILAEVREVLARPKTLRKFPLLSSEWGKTFLEGVESRAMVLTQVPRAFALTRDPKDEPYLNLALAAEARYLVSRDRDLLDLMEDPTPRRPHRQSDPLLTEKVRSIRLTLPWRSFTETVSFPFGSAVIGRARVSSQMPCPFGRNFDARSSPAATPSTGKSATPGNSPD